MPNDSVLVPDAPSLPGLVFRRFRGPEDFEGMAAAISAGAEADGVERADSAADLALSYSHLTHCDLGKDFLIVELDGRIGGYCRVQWDIEEATKTVVCGLVGFLAPPLRHRGVGRALLGWQEARIREVVDGLALPGSREFRVFCADGEEAKARLLEGEGYRPTRYFNEMVRPSLDDIPAFSLPPEFETRPVGPGEYRAIWDAWQDALVDHWGYVRPGEEDYRAWLEDPRLFQPGIWQVAWERGTGRVAGGVLGFIDREENAKYGRKRGYTECISVGREWRRRGVARALIAGSLRAQKAAGMTESALGVDSESLTGATRVYADCGFRVVKTARLFRKDF